MISLFSFKKSTTFIPYNNMMMKRTSFKREWGQISQHWYHLLLSAPLPPPLGQLLRGQQVVWIMPLTPSFLMTHSYPTPSTLCPSCLLAKYPFPLPPLSPFPALNPTPSSFNTDLNLTYLYHPPLFYYLIFIHFNHLI